MSQKPTRLAQRMRKSPPLPDFPEREPGTIPTPASDAAGVPTGCYLLLCTPIHLQSLPTFQGTCRIDRSTGQILASGDLYERPFDPDTGTLATPPDPKAGIPVFPIAAHRFYLRVTRFVETDHGFTMAFDAHHCIPTALLLLDGGSTVWPSAGSFSAEMLPVDDAGVTNADGRFAGQLRNAAGTAIATMSMDLVSPFLRKATLEIDTVAGSPLPLRNSAGLGWKDIFTPLGWDLTVIEGDRNIAEPYDKTWNNAEGHAAMLAARDKVDLDTEWRYHILAVQQVDPDVAPFGVMYDRDSFNDNNAAREGLLIASHWRFPADEPKWGLVRGQLTGETDTYFRTAIHELGHAMGLEHTERTRNYMASTVTIAEFGAKTPETPFPKNVVWAFMTQDEHRLRHWSDLVVRPGGLGFTSGDLSALGALTSPHIRLEIAPASESVPLGAPVRIEASATNHGPAGTVGPASLGLGSGSARGWVIDPTGVSREFSPLTLGEQGLPADVFDENERLEESLTLLRGGDGALFPVPGRYRVILEVSWIADSVPHAATAETEVAVSPAVDMAHADLARRLMATPNLLLTLAFGGDHLSDAVDAIGAALKNPVLRPHYAYIEAKRLSTRFLNRRPDPQAVARLVDDSTVMSRSERKKAARLLQGGASAGVETQKVAAPAQA